jgi:uncharacterized protein (DUF608 family)
MKISRRGALGLTAGMAVAGMASRPVKAGLHGPAGRDIDLSAAGTPTLIDAHAHGRFAGVPVGGIGCGTVYCSADGRLWVWDIFNAHHEGVVPADDPHPVLTSPHGGRLRERDGANYARAPEVGSGPWPVVCGTELELRDPAVGNAASPDRREVSAAGFGEVRMRAQPPGARIDFADPGCPISIQLNVWTPYVPGDIDMSSHPAVVMEYRLTNRSTRPISAQLRMRLENRVLRGAGERNDAPIVNEVFTLAGGAGVSMFADTSRQPFADLPDLRERPDYGSMALVALGNQSASHPQGYPLQSPAHDRRFDSHPWAPPIGTAQSQVLLAPGGEETIRFVIAWHFPNLQLQAKTWDADLPFALSRTRRHYVSHFDDAKQVATTLAADIESSARKTRSFHQTWYDSTLPQWLLEQAMNANTALQTNTFLRFEDGRFWAWEGIGCCPGTCTHVWQYAQSPARLFPEVERRQREEVDFGLAQNADGSIGMRAEYDRNWAADGQAGCILRAYREHLQSPDGTFLERIWPRVAKAMDFMIARDGEGGAPDGIIAGRQHNTLDADWHGRVPFLASLYAAALHCATAMANTLGDSRRAARYAALAAMASEQFGELFDDELGHYVQRNAPGDPPAIGQGRGCHIDQSIGQWWAWQLGLGRIFDARQLRSALHRTFELNHYRDVAPLWEGATEPSRRPLAFALPGEAGTVTCAWAEGVARTDDARHWMAGYFNSCMTGFEFQLAGHMMWESDADPALLDKGLTVARAVFDRYAPDRRNPFNMIEASDHYARAMAAHGMVLALCGFAHDGPRGHIAFHPRLAGEGGAFKAPFTAATGWGSYTQAPGADGGLRLRYAVRHGTLDAATIGARLPAGRRFTSARLADRTPLRIERQGDDITIRLPQRMAVMEGSDLDVMLS